MKVQCPDCGRVYDSRENHTCNQKRRNRIVHRDDGDDDPFWQNIVKAVEESNDVEDRDVQG